MPDTKIMNKEQERWIARFKGHYGDPVGISEFRAGEITFREMYDRSLKYADNLFAEVQGIHSDAFNYEE